MKLKAFIILCLLLSFIRNVNAQKKYIGFSGGIVHPFTENNDGTLEMGYKESFSAILENPDTLLESKTLFPNSL